MYPVLFSIGSLHIYAYGVMLALGLLLGTILNCWLAKSNGFRPERIQNSTLWIMLAALAGTRVFYVLIEYHEFTDQPWWRMFFIWEGGMVFYGGLIGGLLMSLWLAWRWKISLLKLYDNLAPGLALGQALGRVGCFLAGCCYGLPWEGPFSVVFNNPKTLAPRGLHLHPAQLYEALAMLAISFILLMFWRKRKNAGQVVCLYGMLAGIERLAVEQFRGDWRGTPLVYDFFTPTAIIAISMLLISVVGWAIIRKRKDNS